VAFSNLGPVTSIGPGQTQRWFYVRNGGADFGFQHAAADIKTPNCELLAFIKAKS